MIISKTVTSETYQGTRETEKAAMDGRNFWKKKSFLSVNIPRPSFFTTLALSFFFPHIEDSTIALAWKKKTAQCAIHLQTPIPNANMDDCGDWITEPSGGACFAYFFSPCVDRPVFRDQTFVHRKELCGSD